MVTKLQVGLHWSGIRTFLFGSFSSSHKFLGCGAARYGVVTNKFRGRPWLLISRDVSESRAQIIDNLVGCSKENFVRTLSKTGTILTKTSNESLIPAQNQRWRRA